MKDLYLITPVKIVFTVIPDRHTVTASELATSESFKNAKNYYESAIGETKDQGIKLLNDTLLAWVNNIIKAIPSVQVSDFKIHYETKEIKNGVFYLADGGVSGEFTLTDYSKSN